ncbi:uncharacterized protein [Littorina saxatilis]|uniref:uncharacterized protein isoform X1 n=1 Tax=Littorina saxatilis TaxID=31220 RepID=UPI0038B63D64
MDFSALLWTWLCCVTMTTGCNAQQNGNTSIISYRTFDVTMRCDLSAFFKTHAHATVNSMQSLQVIHNATGQRKTDVLATLDIPAKTYNLSSFLNSSNRIYVLQASANSKEAAWLSISLANVYTHPQNELYYQCRVAYYALPGGKNTPTESAKIWNSQLVRFAPQIAAIRREGIEVRVSEGITLKCPANGNQTTIERFDLDARGLRSVCRGSKEPSRAKCKVTEFRTVGGTIVTQRAHLFNASCADEGTYLCRLFKSSHAVSSYSTLQVIMWHRCPVVQPVLSAADIATRVGLSLVAFVILACVILAVIFFTSAIGHHVHGHVVNGSTPSIESSSDLPGFKFLPRCLQGEYQENAGARLSETSSESDERELNGTLLTHSLASTDQY